MVFVASNMLRNLLVVSLVILFLRSLVTTSPSGNLFANVVASGGLASILSRSYSGNKFTIFWLCLNSVNSFEDSFITFDAFNTNKW